MRDIYKCLKAFCFLDIRHIGSSIARLLGTDSKQRQSCRDLRCSFYSHQACRRWASVDPVTLVLVMARVDYVKKAPYIEPTAAVASALLRFNDSPFTSASYQAIVDASSEVYAPKDVDPAQSVQLTRAYDQQDRRLIRLAWMDRHLQGFDWEDWRAQKKLAKHKSINYLMTNEGVVAEVSRLKKLGNGKGSLSRADTIRFTELKAGVSFFHLVTRNVSTVTLSPRTLTASRDSARWTPEEPTSRHRSSRTSLPTANCPTPSGTRINLCNKSDGQPYATE